MSSDKSERKDTDSSALPSVKASDEAAATVDLGSQIDRVLTVLLVPGGNPVTELKALDKIFEQSGSPKGIIDTTARRLFQQSSTFDNLAFQSSLLSGGSNFFGLVIRRMGELVDAEPALAEAAKLPVLIRLVEHYRRGNKNDKMNEFAARVERDLGQRVSESDPLALGQLAKVRYEQSMGAYNEKNFDQAVTAAQESARLCDRAQDTVGKLSALMNISGLLLPTQGKWHEGLELSTQVSDEAETLSEKSPDDPRLQRIAMNCYFHRINMLVKNEGSFVRVQLLLDKLNRNPIYIASKDEAWAKDPVDKALKYIEIAKP